MAWSGKKILIGCAVGCGGLIVLGIALAIAFGVWLNQPGELLEPQKLLGGDTTGYVEWTLRLEDPGTEGFVRAMLERVRSMQEYSSEELPPWFSEWFVQRQARQTERDVMRMFPIAVAWTIRPGPGDEDLHLFSASLERFGNRMVLGDWMLGLILGRTGDAEIERYRGEKIYGLPGRDAEFVRFFLRGSDIFFTNDLDTAKIGIDRMLVEAVIERDATELDRLFTAIEGNAPLRGAVTNRRGELVRAWQQLRTDDLPSVDDAPWDELRGVSFSGGLAADGSLTVNARLLGPDAAWAATHAQSFAAALDRGLEWNRLDTEIQATPAGDRIDVELRIADLIGIVGNNLEDH